MDEAIDQLVASGAVQTVGDILEQDERAPSLARFVLPRLGDTPPNPEPGIYFGMDEDAYHAVPALSSSGIKSMASSPMLFWAKSWLNPERDDGKGEDEKEFRTLGRAYHCRILEGAPAFMDRFCIALDRADYPDVIESTDDIKAELLKAGETPVSRVPTGEMAPVPKKPGEMKAITRSAVKADWIEQLLSVDPDARVWSALVAAHARENAGKSFISAEAWKRLAIGAAMIERDEQLSKALTGGWPEVSLFWTCPRTGVPMKARVDYLKMKMMVDLKTVANQQEMSIERAIAREIAGRKYTIQPSVYFEGADEVRKLVRQRGAEVVHGSSAQVDWALKWCHHSEPDRWLWIFQQKGIAPVTRGLFYPRAGTTKMLTDDIVSMQKRRFVEFAARYGADPWLDLAEIYDIADEDIPGWSTDI